MGEYCQNCRMKLECTRCENPKAKKEYKEYCECKFPKTLLGMDMEATSVSYVTGKCTQCGLERKPVKLYTGDELYPKSEVKEMMKDLLEIITARDEKKERLYWNFRKKYDP